MSSANHHLLRRRGGASPDDVAVLESGIELQRTSVGATVRVSGPLTTSVRAQLGAVLDWVVATGVPRCTIHLATGQGIDLALLRLLRAARARLAGELRVSTDSPEAGLMLGMVGLSDPKPPRPLPGPAGAGDAGEWGGASFGVAATWSGPGRALVTASGELDLAAVDRLGAVLAEQCGTGRRVQLDLSAVSFMDCACLSVLITAHRRCEEAHGALALTGLGPQLVRLLRLTGLDRTLLTPGRSTTGSPCRDVPGALAGARDSRRPMGRSTPDPAGWRDG